MTRITRDDFDKFCKLLAKEGQQGGYITFRTDGTLLKITTMDRNAKEITIELSDTQYPFMPRITRTETF